MSGPTVLAWRYLRFHPWRTALLVLALAISGFLPVVVHLAIGRYDQDLTARARETPLVVGAPGSRHDLLLSALYLRGAPLAPLPAQTLRTIRATGLGVVAPIRLVGTARAQPVVGTDLDYFEARGLTIRTGRHAQVLGEAVLGAEAAVRLGVAPGQTLRTDQFALFDLSQPTPLNLRVVGILDRTGAADDQAVFIDIKTAWIVEGIGHGHVTSPSAIADPSLPMDRELSRTDLATVHFHGDADDFPLTAVLVWPRDTRANTLLKARLKAMKGVQTLIPTEVIAELMRVVLRVRGFLNANFVLVATAQALFMVLVIWLTLRMRYAEFATLRRLGCARGVLVRAQLVEWGTIAVLSATLALLAVALTLQLLPDLAAL